MDFAEIQSQIEAEIQNKRAYNKVLEKIEEQLKITKKAEILYVKEKEKLEKLMKEKEALTKLPQQKSVESNE
ncbi:MULTISPECIES: hypothetical protein [Campylobacter]|uniref:hypothetical protein n=1 Tax=Campylobacter TaxID=194 RepID=UPI0023F38090|nr:MULTISPECIES: hypothetical protein [Campylobacter]MCI6641481.1 hypothetical protein [Campylobacter sp.]MDD7422161.1 hypothetical protein [Campylobacter hominis]MDY3117822.1 hypothetical protein [Campylobacter hominis]